MQTASQMTVEQISDSMLAGIKELRDKGKDLSNGWEVMELSFPEIVGGGYNPGYGQGGPETMVDTVMRMSALNSSRIDLPTLQKIIKSMEMTLIRDEFTGDELSLLAKGWIESYIVSLNQIASQIK